MKILYIANARIPTEKAHGIQIMNMCEALAAAGADVELVVPERKNNIADDPFRYYGVKPLFKIVRLKSAEFWHLGSLGYALRTHSFLRKAARYARREPGARAYTRELLAPRYLPDAVVEAHTRSGSRLARAALRRARRVVAITKGLKDALVKDGVPEERVAVLPDGVDLAAFDIPVSRAEARAKLGLPPDAKIALYAGSFSLYAWKGVDVFLKAARLAPDVLFLAVGGTEREARQLVGDVPENVRCTGFKPHAEIPLYLKAADVLVLPNAPGDPMSERYTSPLKLFEYMASGTPIVASDLPSIRETLSEDMALFARAGDARALAEGVRAALMNAAASARAEKARADAARYTWRARAERLLELLA